MLLDIEYKVFCFYQALKNFLVYVRYVLHGQCGWCIDSILAASNTEDSDALKWPTIAELNMRVRRLVSRFQKQQKQMRSRLMGLDQGLGKSKLREKEKV